MLTRQHYHWNCFWHAEYDCLKMRLVVSKTAHTNYHIINRSLVQVLFHSAKSFRYANFNEFSLRIFACECTYYKALRIVIELKNRDQLWKLSIEATASFDSGQLAEVYSLSHWPLKYRKYQSIELDSEFKLFHTDIIAIVIYSHN